MSGPPLKVITIDVLKLEDIAQKHPMRAIDTALNSLDVGEWPEKNSALPDAIKQLLIWRNRERLICSKTFAGLAINLIYAPILLGGFVLYGGQLIWSFLFALSLPFGLLGIFSLWARKRNWFAKKISLLREEPFVALVNDLLFENIPERTALLADANALKENIAESETRTLKLETLMMQMKQMSSDLKDADISRSIQEIQAEKAVQKQLRARAKAIIKDIDAAIIEIDRKREEIHKRAKLEMLRRHAQQLTESDGMKFSTDAIASLTVDRIEFQYRLASLQTDMADAALKWKTENEVNA